MTNPIEKYREDETTRQAAESARITLFKENERHNESLHQKFREVSTFFSFYEILNQQKLKFSKHTGKYQTQTEVLSFAGLFNVALPESVMSPYQRGDQRSHSLTNNEHAQDYVGYILSSACDPSDSFLGSRNGYDWNIYMIQITYDRFENLHFIGGHGVKTLAKSQWENNISVVGEALGECLEFPSVVTIHREPSSGLSGLTESTSK